MKTKYPYLVWAVFMMSMAPAAWSVPVDEYYQPDQGASRSTASVSDTSGPTSNSEYVNARTAAMNSPSNGTGFRGQNFR